MCAQDEREKEKHFLKIDKSCRLAHVACHYRLDINHCVICFIIIKNKSKRMKRIVSCVYFLPANNSLACSIVSGVILGPASMRAISWMRSASLS